MIDKTIRVVEFDKVLERLAGHTAFSAGHRLALDLRPSADAREVRRRLALTREARDVSDRRNVDLLGGARDVRNFVEAAARGRVLLPDELLAIRSTLGAARRSKSTLTREAARWPHLAEIAATIDAAPAVHDAIEEALDEEGEVRDDASPALRTLRRKNRVARDRIVRQIESLARGAAKDLMQDAPVTQRNGRWVLPIKADFRARLPGVVHDTSDSGHTVFVEPLQVIEPGNAYRQGLIEEEKEVERILRALSADVANEAEALNASVEALAEIDLALACAAYGHEIKGVTPEIVDEGPPMFRFDAARHPLLDPVSVVPIDIHIGDHFRLLVVTGPNTGGKTVALKTVGLLVIMAQSGLQIPTEDGARLSVFEGVYADIGDEQSIEQSLSTFSGHMTNIVRILARVEERSLVLLDELGAGTDPTEGAALAGAILDWLRERHVTTIASTHYTELKAYAWSTDEVANASVEFDVESLRPTYVLTIGLPGRSNALAIAARLGLEASIIERARQGLTVSQVEMEDMLSAIKDTNRAAAEDRAAAASARRASDEWSARLELALAEIREERAKMLNVARRQAEQELAAAREAIDAIVRRAEGRAAAREVLESELDEIETILATEERVGAAAVDPTVLEPGSRVRVLSFDQVGELLDINDTRDEVDVQLGILRLRIPLTDIEYVGPPEATDYHASSSRVIRHDATSTGMEVDVRGMTVEEAIDAVERRLNDALLSDSPWVHIVHGHGTGALKRALRDFLRSHPSVTRMRAGERGEGGDGVTIAYFE